MTQPPTPQRQGVAFTVPPGHSKAEAHERNLALGQALLGTAPQEKLWRGPADEACGALATRLIPSAVGRIDRLLLTVPWFYQEDSADVVDPWQREHFKAILGHLGDQVLFTIVCHFEQQDEIRRWFDELNIDPSRLQLVLSKYDYLVWAQDAYIALHSEHPEPILCEGVRFLRHDDMVIADDVAAQTDVRQLHSILEFQGGNFLGGIDTHLVGKDYIEGNLGRVRLETPERVVAEFERLLGGRVVVLGLDERIPEEERRGTITGEWQPLFHIDMYITRTGVQRDGKEVVLVGSPREARRLLDQAERPEDQDGYYDQAAEQLCDHGFAVDRIPLLPVREAPQDWPQQDYVLTWNNVVIHEVFDGPEAERRRVLLPTFADPDNPLGVEQSVRETLDAAAMKIWEDLGFWVLKIERMEDLAYAAGSVHCITKVLQRTLAP
jgi:hypothetical protein